MSYISFSQSQIDDIISVIPETNSAVNEIAALNREKLREIVSRQLKELSYKRILKREITPQDIEYIKDYILRRCEKAVIQPGENVGLLASESISQPISQSNLNTKSVSGSSEGFSDIRVFTEILNLSKNRKQPTATIHLKNSTPTSFFTEIDMFNISKVFIKVPLKNLFYGNSYNSSIEFVKGSLPKSPFYNDFGKILKKYNEKKYEDFTTYVMNFNKNSEFLRINFNILELFRTRITTRDIAAQIEKLGGIICVFSPTKIGIVDIYITEFTTKQKDKLIADIISKKNKEKNKDGRNQLNEEFFKSDILNDDNKSSIFLQVSILPQLYSNKIFIKSSTILREFNTLLREENPIAFFDTNATEFKDIEVKKYIIEHFFKFEIIDREKEVIELYIDFNKMFFETGVDMEVIKSYLKRYETSEGGNYDFIYGSGSKKDIIYVKNKDKKTQNSINFSILKKIKENKTERFYLKGYLYMNSAQLSSIKNTFSTSLMNTTKLSSTYEKDINTSNSSTLNILFILRGMYHLIDNRYTITNNFYEMYNNFGIETVRYIIMRELKDKLIKEVNMAHIKLITDVMTNYGILTGFTHNSTSLKNFGAYFNSSFEQALQSFKKAALNGKEEFINSTSTCILFGKKCNFGTGMFKLLDKNEFLGDGEERERGKEEVDEEEIEEKVEVKKKYFNKKLMD